MDLSVIIPARNEMFLAKTVENILENIEGDTEVIAILDGEWANPPIPDHPRVTLIHHQSIGQRASTNEGVKLSQAKYIMKADAHCAFDKGFDVKMMKELEGHHDWTLVPRMYNLHAFDWVCENGHRRYQGPSGECKECGKPTKMDILWKPRLSRKSDFMRFDKDLHFQYWGHFEERPEAKADIAPQMCCVGACWMMHRDRYWELGGLDETHGSWGQMGVEIACKSWLSGGAQMVNKKTWFAHMFRTQGADFGFPYPLSGHAVGEARKRSKELWKEGKWDKAKYPLQWMIDKFNPPEWETTKSEVRKGCVYYTDNSCEADILKACQKQILKCATIHKMPVVSVSQKPIDFGRNVVMELPRSTISMFKQILRGIEECDADVIYLLEHDVLYHPSHFEFIPPRKDVFYYDHNKWCVCNETGKAIHYLSDCMSVMCAYKDMLLEHFRAKVAFVEKNGYKSKWGFSPPKGLPREERKGVVEHYFAKDPCIDIRRGTSHTRKRMDKSEFRSERSCRGWTEADAVPSWGITKGRFNEFLAEAVK